MKRTAVMEGKVTSLGLEDGSNVYLATADFGGDLGNKLNIELNSTMNPCMWSGNFILRAAGPNDLGRKARLTITVEIL